MLQTASSSTQDNCALELISYESTASYSYVPDLWRDSRTTNYTNLTASQKERGRKGDRETETETESERESMSTSGATAKLPAVPQLNGNNIHLWKIKLVQHLRPQGLAQYVQKNIMAPDTLEEREKWEKERVAVFDIILAHTEDVIDQLVEEGGWDMDTQEDPKDLVDIAVSLFSKKKEKKKSADVIGTDEHPNSEEDAETFISSESIQPGSPLRE